ncbi:MAG TPA: hypothetical protein DDW30_01665 [Clostridiales bacterium]|nr:hypothetical protein [Clostridiales bacterium]
MTENTEPNGNIERQLAEQGFYVSTTVGCSMRPMLRNRRDRVIVLPIGDERLKKYDLPLYRRPDGKYILHRIIGVRDGKYVIRGDNTYAKEYVPDAWVLGYVSEFYRGKRHVLSTARSYRFYACVWNLIYPVRHLFHIGRTCAARVWHKIKPKKHSV